jgi:hypothetical protein
MPAETLEGVKNKAQTLAQRLAEKKSELDPEKLRAMKKRVRRAQRKRRRLQVSAERSAGKPKEKQPEGS